VLVLDDIVLSKKNKYPNNNILICDDAPQFKLLTEELSLCWVDEARHYKKLSPIVPSNERKLENTLTQLWDYYGELLKYKENPTDEMKKNLNLKFDEIFSLQTGYKDLDDRLSKTLGTIATPAFHLIDNFQTMSEYYL